MSSEVPPESESRPESKSLGDSKPLDVRTGGMTGDVADSVGRASDFWRMHEQKLRATQAEWRGREDDYLNIVREKQNKTFSQYRLILFYYLGYDVLNRIQHDITPPGADKPIEKDYLLNVERIAMEIMKTSDMVNRAMDAARAAGQDPMLAGYEMFFYAMNNVPQAETLYLMMDIAAMDTRTADVAALQEECTLLMAGWADQELSLFGPQATRLWDGVKEEGRSPRESLRERLPGAVLEAAQEFRPGEELLVNEATLPRPGKATAGRRPRSLRSRIARKLERPTAAPLEQYVDEPVATRSSRQSVPADSASGRMSSPADAYLTADTNRADHERLSLLWGRVAAKYRTGTKMQRLAEYLRDRGGVTVGVNRRLRLITGVRQEIAEHLGVSPEQVSVQWYRIHKALLALR